MKELTLEQVEEVSGGVGIMYWIEGAATAYGYAELLISGIKAIGSAGIAYTASLATAAANGEITVRGTRIKGK